MACKTFPFLCDPDIVFGAEVYQSPLPLLPFQTLINTKLRHERMSIDAQDLPQLSGGQTSRGIVYQLDDCIFEISKSGKTDILIFPDSERIKTSDNRERKVFPIMVITVIGDVGTLSL